MKRMKNIFVAFLFLYPFLFACGQSNDGEPAAVIQEVQTESAGQPALTPVVETKTSRRRLKTILPIHGEMPLHAPWKN